MTRSMTYIIEGDSACHFSSFSANGTLTGRVALTGERDGYVAAVDRAAGEGLGDTEVGQCSPRDRGGIGRMTRIGQVRTYLLLRMAYPLYMTFMT